MEYNSELYLYRDKKNQTAIIRVVEVMPQKADGSCMC